MADDPGAADLNGGAIDPRTPQRPPLERLPALPVNATWQDLARAYATVVANDYAHKKAQYGELDEIRMGLVALDRSVTRFKSDVREVVFEAAVGRGPMRAAAPSTHDSAERVAMNVKERFVAQSVNPASPDPTPDDVQKMVAEAVTAALVAEKQRADLERLAALDAAKKEAHDAEKKSREDARSQRRNWLVLTTSGLLLLIAGSIVAAVQQRAQGHSEGVAEAPAKIVYVPLAASAPPAPPAIPASAIPR